MSYRLRTLGGSALLCGVVFALLTVLGNRLDLSEVVFLLLALATLLAAGAVAVAGLRRREPLAGPWKPAAMGAVAGLVVGVLNVVGMTVFFSLKGFDAPSLLSAGTLHTVVLPLLFCALLSGTGGLLAGVFLDLRRPRPTAG